MAFFSSKTKHKDKKTMSDETPKSVVSIDKGSIDSKESSTKDSNNNNNNDIYSSENMKEKKAADEHEIQHEIDDLLHISKPKDNDSINQNPSSACSSRSKRPKTPTRTSLLDTKEEETRMKRYRDRTKNKLTPRHSRDDYSAISEIDDDDDDDKTLATHATDHEFQNLVADKEGTSRNAKCEWLGKWGVSTVLALQALIYVVGLSSLIIYALYVRHHSPALSTMHSIMPTIFHGIGISITVILKTYYDFSPKVGHLESMHLIIRSRLWLFPGVLGTTPERVKRSELEASRREEISKPSWEEFQDNPEFGMTHFLQRCQFPEFRVLFRAFELYPYSHVTELAKKDEDYADKITVLAQNQIMRVFPILDFLDVAGSIPSLMNPVNWYRLSKRFGAYLIGQQAQVIDLDDLLQPNEDDGIVHPCYMTRSEDVEVDDSGKQAPSYAQRTEPHPWGTVRLEDYKERFHAAVFYSNFVGFLYYFFSLSAYVILIFGEVNFYTRLSIARRNANGGHHQGGGEEDLDDEEVANEFMRTYDDDDYYSWSLEFDNLHGFAFFGCILLFLAFPFGVQASALMAENAVVPMLVVETLKAHVANFTVELDQYLKLLAVNKGSLSHDPYKEVEEQGGTVHDKEEQLFLMEKMAMTRDMALSWRMTKFLAEVEHDCGVINSSVAIMILNFICHIIPLNIYLFDSQSCIPIWILLFCLAQVISLFIIIMGGIEANEMTNDNIDGLLHGWQLKFNMIGWSGGFIELGDNGDMRGFVARDPPGETKADIMRKEKEPGNHDYGTIIRASQLNRLQSIVKVLEHYEGDTITPFKVLSVTVTRDMLTLVLGFFGGSIVAVLSAMIDNKDHFRPQFMCHRFLDRPDL